MGLEKLKLNKQLAEAMNSLGYESPTKVQAKTISRIVGGQELIVTAHEKSGKTTASLVALLKQLKAPKDYDARAILLVPTKAHVEAALEKLEVLNKELQLRCAGIFSGVGMTGQSDLLFEGVDIIIATPERLAELYNHKGIILKKITTFIIDGAEEMLERGLISSVHRIMEGLPQKYQRVMFTEMYDHRLRKLVDKFFDFPTFIEVELEKKGIETISHGLYQTPNYRTKQNLVILLLQDYEWYTKTVIFVNTQVTCQNLYKSLDRRFIGEVSTLNARYIDHQSYDSIEEFKESDSRILMILHDEKHEDIDLSDFPEVFNFDIPIHLPFYSNLVNKKRYTEKPPVISSLATSTELLGVSKIENLIGEKIERWQLPAGLIIEGTRQRTTEVESQEIPKGGGAFHEKKWKNRKEHNYTYHNPKPSDKKKRNR